MEYELVTTPHGTCEGCAFEDKFLECCNSWLLNIGDCTDHTVFKLKEIKDERTN